MRLGRATAVAFALVFTCTTDVLAGECESAGYSAVTDTTILGGWLIEAINDFQGGSPTEDWREDHCLTTEGVPGNLYKAGDGSAVDPRALRGTWTPNSDGTVTYNYGSPATTYTWRLYSQRGLVSLLCWENKDTGEMIATGGGGSDPAGLCP